jgi:UbiD family decarboxylase
MLQRPVPLIRCKTIPLDVSADAEIVLECEIRPGERRAEAPFGEFPGTYGSKRMNPVLEVKAMTRRRNPLAVSVTRHLPRDGDMCHCANVCDGRRLKTFTNAERLTASTSRSAAPQ